MLLPFLIFWGIIILSLVFRLLSWRAAVVAIAIWAGLLYGCYYSGMSPYVFVAIQALMDIVLILIIFKGDIAIR